jgi:uncharacterized protein involved in cysteine biosynthesis
MHLSEAAMVVCILGAIIVLGIAIGACLSFRTMIARIAGHWQTDVAEANRTATKDSQTEDDNLDPLTIQDT